MMCKVTKNKAEFQIIFALLIDFILSILFSRFFFFTLQLNNNKLYEFISRSTTFSDA